MAPKRPPAAFEVHFDGEGLYPEKIPLRTLSDALSAVQRLVTGAGYEEEEDEEERDEQEDDTLRLLEVRRGSAVYKVSGPPPLQARKNLRLAGRFLDSPESVDAEHDYLLSPIERLSSAARRLGCTITLREPSRKKALGAVMARIEPNSYEGISKSLLVEGGTSILGTVMRVGGVTGTRCGLRVPFQQRMLICRVKDSAVARLIGQRLYQDVEVFGQARWLRNSWRLFSFTIQEVREQPIQGSILDAMEELREAGGKAWDEIEDPRAYLEEIENGE